MTARKNALLTPLAVFSPLSRDELIRAVDDCLGVPSENNRSTRLHGPIGKWDVSQVTNMSKIFRDLAYFNYTLSNWDVSRVTNMELMFDEASSFQQTLCGAAWVNSKASKDEMFTHSLGSISDTVRGTWWMLW